MHRPGSSETSDGLEQSKGDETRDHVGDPHHEARRLVDAEACDRCLKLLAHREDVIRIALREAPGIGALVTLRSYRVVGHEQPPARCRTASIGSGRARRPDERREARYTFERWRPKLAYLSESFAFERPSNAST